MNLSCSAEAFILDQLNHIRNLPPTILDLILDEFADQPVRLLRIREEIAMSLVGQHHELGIRDSFGQDFRRHPVIDFAGDVPVALTN